MMMVVVVVMIYCLTIIQLSNAKLVRGNVRKQEAKKGRSGAETRGWERKGKRRERVDK